MKNQFRTKVLVLVMLFTMVSLSLTAAEYYVVIGSFAEESNARRFAKTISSTFKEVTYSFNQARKVYFVHVMKTTRKEEARNWSLYLRNEKGFRDAWVLAFPEDHQNTVATSEEGDGRTPRYSQHMLQQFADTRALASSSSIDEMGKYDVFTVENASSRNIAWTVDGDISFATGIRNLRGELLSSSQRFKFIVETPEGKILPSEVMLVNFEKVKKIASFQPGEEVAIRPARKNHIVTFVCDELGYGMETRMFNMDHLSRGRDIQRNKDGVWEVRFKLKKLELNELSFMNKTRFYKDAAVLEPSAETQMNDLVLMMQTNPGYKIVIHTHCNAGTRRNIKLPLDKNYFNLENAVDKAGSDKLLTRKRAEVIRTYLMNHGIDKKRIGMVGWGSTDPLVESTASDAHINERIEIELVAE